MQIQNQFELPISPAESWTVVTDLPRVARCLPGAQITEIRPDGTHLGTVAVALGPASLSFAGEASIAESDAASHRLVVQAAGGERRGRGRASARIDVRLTAIDDGTRVDVDAELDLAGSIAQYGRRGGMLEDVSELLIDEFTDALREEILHGEPSSTADLAALGGAAAADAASAPTATPSRAATAASTHTVSARSTGDGSTGALTALIPAPAATPGSPASRRPERRAMPVTATAQVTPPVQSSVPRAPASRLSALTLARKLLMRRLRRLVKRRGRPGSGATPEARS